MQLIDKSKCNPELGQKVFSFLKEKGLLNHYKGATLSDEEQNKIIDESLRTIFETIGFNMEDPNFQDTPRRVRKYLRDTKAVMNWDYFPKIMTVPEDINGPKDSFIKVGPLRCISTCSHHLAPFMGVVPSGNKDVVFGPGMHIAYIPRGKILGLSKFQSIIDFLGAVIPTTQENLTAVVGWAISYIMETPDVIVYCKAYHSCMYGRSSYSPSATTTLWCHPESVFATNNNIRSEFLALARD